MKRYEVYDKIFDNAKEAFYYQDHLVNNGNDVKVRVLHIGTTSNGEDVVEVELTEEEIQLRNDVL